jgi:hypothetical protein
MSWLAKIKNQLEIAFQKLSFLKRTPEFLAKNFFGATLFFIFLGIIISLFIFWRSLSSSKNFEKPANFVEKFDEKGFEKILNLKKSQELNYSQIKETEYFEVFKVNK